MKQLLAISLVLAMAASLYAQENVSQISVEESSGKFYCASINQIINFSEDGILTAYSPSNQVMAVGVYGITETYEGSGKFGMEYYLANCGSSLTGYESVHNNRDHIISWTPQELKLLEDGRVYVYQKVGEAPNFDPAAVKMLEQYFIARNGGTSLPWGWKNTFNAIIQKMKTYDTPHLQKQSNDFSSAQAGTSHSGSSTSNSSNSSSQNTYVQDRKLLGKWYSKEFNTFVDFGENEVFSSFTPGPQESSSLGLYGVKPGTNKLTLHYTTTVLAELTYRFKDPKTLILTYQGEDTEYTYVKEADKYTAEDGKKVGQMIMQGIDRLSAQMTQYNMEMMNRMHRTNMQLIDNMGGNTTTEYYEIDQYGNKVRKY
ncbi:MAG: hypothetical protein R3B93_00650 [Bacteroidia bacterium]